MQETDAEHFIYPARAERVVDGDTLVLTIDLGFNISKQSVKVRLLNVDAHEIHFVSHGSLEYQKGMEEKQFVSDWLNKAQESTESDWPLLVDTVKGDNTGKYGRYLAYLYAEGMDQSLNSKLIEQFDKLECED
jgi:endonuclease YncB( thermonuclease family)